MISVLVTVVLLFFVYSSSHMFVDSLSKQPVSPGPYLICEGRRTYLDKRTECNSLNYWSFNLSSRLPTQDTWLKAETVQVVVHMESTFSVTP